MMQKKFLFWLSAILYCFPLFAQKGLNLSVKIDNYAEKELVLGFHYGNKQYLKNTVNRNADGTFTFQADTLLPCGVYLLILKPDNQYFQIMMDGDQDFSIYTDAKDVVNTMQVKGSVENEGFYNYLRTLTQMRFRANTIRKQLNASNSPADSIRLTQDLSNLDIDVKTFQLETVKKNAGTLTAKIIQSDIEPEMPPVKGKVEKDNQLNKQRWLKKHFFDNIDVADPCLLRSSVLHDKVAYFIYKITLQYPDSINQSVDYVLSRMKPGSENFKYFLIYFLNFYAKSEMKIATASYVHIAKKYYATGKAPWTKKEDLEKIIENANRLESELYKEKSASIDANEKLNDHSKTGFKNNNGKTTLVLKKGTTLTADALKSKYNWDGDTKITGPLGGEINKLKDYITDKDRILVREDPAIIWHPSADKCWVGGLFSIGNLNFSGYIKAYGKIPVAMSGNIFGLNETKASDLNILIENLTLIEILDDTDISFYKPDYLVHEKNYSMKDAQLTLKKLGYDPGLADGKFGKKTEEALKAFQKDNKLSITGKLDKKTIELLAAK